MELKATHSPLKGGENPTIPIVHSGTARKENIKKLEEANKKVSDKVVLPQIKTNKTSN